MKRVPILLALVIACSFMHAQNDDRIAKTKTPISQIEQVRMPSQDNQALLATELERRGPGIAPRFAVNLETDISPNTHGNWEILSNGNAVWRLRIFSERAKSLNLGFTKYHMPSGGSLILYSPDQRKVMGPFTPADNEEHEQLWTPVLDGEELVIEVQVPAGNRAQLELELKFVNHDFIGFSEMASGSCNLDVICGEADGWEIVDAYRDIIQSVAVIGTGGGTFCTGFLVNNVRQDCTPYFMTANHCGINNGNAPSLVAYWNFFNSTCRQPNTPQSGSPGDGSLADFNTGAIFRAGWGSSDFTLVELDDPVSLTADAFYAGWSAEDFAPQDTVIAIHHPSTDEKRISFEFEPTFISDYLGNMPDPSGTHITVEDWDFGTTEGGSSGSPLFNNEKRVVGQLHGGWAACGNDDLDSYGWFYSSWEGGGSPATRLKDWLDPDDTGLVVLDGREDTQCNFTVGATPAVAEICAPDTAFFTVTVSANFQTDVDLTINGLPAELMAGFSENPIAPGGSTTLMITNTNALSSGIYQFTILGTDGTESNFINITLTLTNGAPVAPTMTIPADGDNGIGLMPIFSWEESPNTTYSIDVATDDNFTDIIMSASNLDIAEFEATVLLISLEKYYWRVKGENICGESGWSATRSFTTAATSCASSISTDIPKNISSGGTPTVTSTIEVVNDGIIDDVNVNDIIIAHSWISDLSIGLTSPAGTTIELMNNVGGGNCPNDNAQLAFDDQAISTYAELDAMCNTTPPALQGTFQPSETLSAFNGENAAGTWTITIHDNANQDGGTFQNWALEICTLIPDDLSVGLSTLEIENCQSVTASFTLQLGTGFNDTSGVSLSANGLPPGATATFDPNPAAPGSTVTVELFGATMGGVFDVDIIADDGTNSASSTLEWTVNTPPDLPFVIMPLPGAVDVPITTSFQWENVDDATYQVFFATDPEFTNIIYGEIALISSIVAPPILEYCTTYYWSVSSMGECGDSADPEIHSFTTEEDFVFFTNDEIEACNTGTILTSLFVDGCFEDTGVQLSVNNLPAGIEIDFPTNPVFVGDAADVEIILNGPNDGTYQLVIEGTDGINAVTETINLTIIGAAPATTMLLPSDGEQDVWFQPMFTWDAVIGATGYLFEIATDDEFNNIVHNENLAAGTTSLDFPFELEWFTTYYWRVTAFNDCGGTTPAPFSFRTNWLDAVVEVNGFQIEILPNPTNGFLQVQGIGQLQSEVLIDLYSINGIHLLENKLLPSIPQATLNLMDFPSGVYLLRLKSGNAVATERIILGK